MKDKLFLGYNHVGIYAQDREKAVKFYTEVFGFEVLFRVEIESDGELIAMLQLGNCRLEILEPPEEIGVLPESCEKTRIVQAATATSNHFAIDVTDIDQALERVRSFGYEVEDREIYDVPNFGSPDLDLRIAFFRGPNGERIELFQEIHK